MSETVTPDPAAAALAEVATLRSTLAALQTDNARLATEAQTVAKGALDLQAALTAAHGEREAFKVEVEALKPRAALADELKVQVEGYVNAGRETALVEALRVKYPSAEPLVIRGTLAALAKAGKVNPHAEDTAAELAKVLPVIAAEAPSLTRPPTGASGTSMVRQVAAPVQKPVSLFRP